MKATHLLITGRVQGVGFRDWLVAEAQRLGLAGWVRNVGRDSVEALIAGDPGAVEVCLQACRRGPHLAAVESVTETMAVPPTEPGFAIRASLPSRP
jgi:acylphosphatase